MGLCFALFTVKQRAKCLPGLKRLRLACGFVGCPLWQDERTQWDEMYLCNPFYCAAGIVMKMIPEDEDSLQRSSVHYPDYTSYDNYDATPIRIMEKVILF